MIVPDAACSVVIILLSVCSKFGQGCLMCLRCSRGYLYSAQASALRVVVHELTQVLLNVVHDEVQLCMVPEHVPQPASSNAP